MRKALCHSFLPTLIIASFLIGTECFSQTSPAKRPGSVSINASTTGSTIDISLTVGVYDVNGTNPTSVKYTGTCQIDMRQDGDFDFTWNVANSVTRGIGKLANGVMSVTYGDTYPAIYTVRNGGLKLDGTWGNNTGKEVLTYTENPVQKLTSSLLLAFGTLGGTYNVDGSNPNGTHYAGTCTITRRTDGDFDFSWNSGGSVSSGIGKLSNNVMTVAFGDPDPAIYRVLENGRKLDGTWQGGKGKEVLTK